MVAAEVEVEVVVEGGGAGTAVTLGSGPAVVRAFECVQPHRRDDGDQRPRAKNHSFNASTQAGGAELAFGAGRFARNSMRSIFVTTPTSCSLSSTSASFASLSTPCSSSIFVSGVTVA